MIIKKQSENHWQIKTTKATISFNDSTSINDFTIPGDGEYEVGGVEAELFDGVLSLYLENIQIVFLDHNKKQFTSAEIKKMGEVNILFVPLAGENTMDTKAALKLISDIDPQIVIPVYYKDLSEFTKDEGVNTEEVDELKINKDDLSIEQRKVYILK